MFKKNYKLLAMFLTMMLFVVGLSGCGQSSNEATTAEVKDSLIVATIYDAKSLDPHATNDVASSNVMQQIYENLVTLDENNQVVPQLAEKFEKLDDKTYKFYLKKGVKFHNGEELKASDVKFTLFRAFKKNRQLNNVSWI